MFMLWGGIAWVLVLGFWFRKAPNHLTVNGVSGTSFSLDTWTRMSAVFSSSTNVQGIGFNYYLEL